MEKRMNESQPGEMRRQRHRKVCQFCKDKMHIIDYKDVGRLRRYINDRGKIIGRRTTGTCTGHQKTLTTAIKRARNMALLPFIVI